MSEKIYWLLVLIPVVIAIRYIFPGQQTAIFLLSALSLIPLASLLSDATDQLAAHMGPTMGALLNVTFGNAGELMVGFFALRAGLVDVVKASLSGSILANTLLFLGASMLAGGIKHRTLTFNSLAARTRATMLGLAAISMIFPAAYHHLALGRSGARESDLSLEFSVVLLVTYCLGLLFTLHTHRDLVAPARRGESADEPAWSLRAAMLVLAGTSVFIGWMGELLANSIEPAAKTIGMSDLFAGIIVVAVTGNAAECTAAIRGALRNRMDLSVGITLGSSIQVALFVAPALVILSYLIGPTPMNLVFTPLEIVALIVSIAIAGQIAGDGDSNWFEGAQLVSVYLMLAIMFYLLPT